jgi:putative glycosyltransferase (TIGR04372 family)
MKSLNFIKNFSLIFFDGQNLNLIKKVKLIFIYICFIPIVLIIRIISPFFLVRFHGLISSRIGHLAANTELYLCEIEAGINKPKKNYIDIFYLRYNPICNQYLVNKWSEVINIWPRWFMHPIFVMNKIIPGGKIHEIGDNTQSDRDVHNLLDKQKQHLTITNEEDKIGKDVLKKMGVPYNSKFICLLVRDSAYLPDISMSYHEYRDCKIENYYLAAESLANLGYYVIRMGAKVNSKFYSKNSKIIDYATNGFRTEFMDIYLGAKCEFCISTSSGWDAIPLIFRRPIIYAPIVPLGYFFTFSNKFIGITKHHLDIKTEKELSLTEIFNRGVGYCLTSKCYEEKGIKLVENSPEEIRDLVLEFHKYYNNDNLVYSTIENQLQEKFWSLFPSNVTDKNGVQLHGEIKSRYGLDFLKKQTNWLN